MSDKVMLDELKARAQKARNVIYLAAHADVAEEVSKLFGALLDRIDELEAGQAWIPVSEHLPKEGQLILYSGPHCVGPFVGRFADSTFYGRSGFLHASDVSHWMPLPPPPKQQEAEDGR